MSWLMYVFKAVTTANLSKIRQKHKYLIFCFYLGEDLWWKAESAALEEVKAEVWETDEKLTLLLKENMARASPSEIQCLSDYVISVGC